jgi:putative protein-disulfide isomerase
MSETQKANPLLCDPEKGVCELPSSGEAGQLETISTEKKSAKVIYFTDPICSTCWGIEPQLRKMKLEYGAVLDVEYHMGGLLPDWSYNSGGISKPSDVAHHWDEVSAYYDMPIDGDVWLEDPLDSSYPPSIAFKAAELQGKEQSLTYLRELREMVFLEKKNIAKWENLLTAAEKVGLDLDQFAIDFEGKGRELFEEDLQLARSLGVRGFPTIFFVDEQGNRERVYGFKPYSDYETAIWNLDLSKFKVDYPTDWKWLFGKYATLTSREFSELSGVARAEGDRVLQELADTGKLEKLSSKNGPLWKFI